MTALLIPGLVCDGLVFEGIATKLAAANPVIADVTSQPTITAMATDLLERHSGRLILIGHSMGGRIAMEMARLAPDRIDGMALLNTGIHPRREGEVEKRQILIDLAYEKGMAGLAAVWLPGMLAAGIEPKPTVLESLTAMVCRMTPEIHERQMRALLDRPDASKTVGAYTGPLLLVTGRQDVWSPISQHEDIARLCPQGRLSIIEEAGHFAPVEQPQAVAEVIANWVSKLSSDTSKSSKDKIPETPLFDRARSHQGYNLNKMAMGLSTPEGRAAFLADEDGYLGRFGLTPEQFAAVKARDWAEMVRLGGNLFYILKISAVDPTPIRAIGAAQAGLSLQDFLDQRLGKVTNG